MRQFHQAQLQDEWVYLSLDGVSLRVRRPSGRKRVQMVVAYGVRGDGRRQLLAFLRTRDESQADWEALLNDLYRRGLSAGDNWNPFSSKDKKAALRSCNQALCDAAIALADAARARFEPVMASGGSAGGDGELSQDAGYVLAYFASVPDRWVWFLSM